MAATATATRQEADSTTRTAPSILSTGRLRAFRPASHRTARDVRRVALRALTFMIIAPRLPDLTSQAQQQARPPLPAGIAARGRYGRAGDGRGAAGPGPGLIRRIALRDSWKAHRGRASRCAAGVPGGGWRAGAAS